MSPLFYLNHKSCLPKSIFRYTIYILARAHAYIRNKQRPVTPDEPLLFVLHQTAFKRYSITTTSLPIHTVPASSFSACSVSALSFSACSGSASSFSACSGSAAACVPFVPMPSRSAPHPPSNSLPASQSRVVATPPSLQFAPSLPSYRTLPPLSNPLPHHIPPLKPRSTAFYPCFCPFSLTAFNHPMDSAR